MRSCWENEPTDRPNFTDLVTQISSLLYEIRDYLPLLSPQKDTPTCNGNGSLTSPVSNSNDYCETKLMCSGDQDKL